MGQFRQNYQDASRFSEGNECARAMSLLDEALKLSPEFADVQYRIGRCHQAHGNWAGAGEYLMRAKELDVAPLRALEDMRRRCAM
jgi:tetratricopeptide (TPR) repeat protein